MKTFLLCAAVVAAVVVPERAAHAIAACGGQTAWALPAKSTVPVHPTVVLYTESYEAASLTQPVATINGKAVTAKMTTVTVGDQLIVSIEIDSTKTGTLKIGWGKADYPPPSVQYTIKKATPVKTVTGKTSRYHVAYQHSTVHELEDGLEVAVDAQAVRFTAKWRRDSNTQWQTVELPAMTRNGKQVAHLGAIGCASNFSVPMLESGIDLELTAVLADGTAMQVSGLPARVVLPKLPKNAPQSSP